MPQPHPNEKDFSLTITVYKDDIDELGHVNNVVYVRWVQEVAAAHWDSLASSEIKQKYVWVVLRHEIDYLSAVFENNTLTVTLNVLFISPIRSQENSSLRQKRPGACWMVLP
jgi:acyl-CoA thioesterase FadM